MSYDVDTDYWHINTLETIGQLTTEKNVKTDSIPLQKIFLTDINCIINKQIEC